MADPVVYVHLRDVEMRWLLRRAALDRRMSIAALTYRIIREWLTANGYEADTLAAPAETLKEKE